MSTAYLQPEISITVMLTDVCYISGPKQHLNCHLVHAEGHHVSGQYGITHEAKKRNKIWGVGPFVLSSNEARPHLQADIITQEEGY